MMLTKKIAESYLIKVKDDQFADALKDSIKQGWIPWGEPTFLLMPRLAQESPMSLVPAVVMVYLVMVKFVPTILAVRKQRHTEE